MTSTFFTSTGGIVFILALLGGGIYVLINGFRNRRRGEASLAWPTVEGTITNTWVDKDYSEDDDGHRSYTYAPRWQYQYDYVGQTHTSEQITYGSTKGYRSQRKAQEALNQFPLHSRVQVYYDPGNPTDSVLIPGSKGTIVGIIIGGIMLVAALVMAGIGFMSR